MSYKNFLDWINNEFCFPVPEDYLLFIKEGDFKSTLRKNYIIDIKDESIIEISDWFTYDDIPQIYKNCIIQRFQKL